MNSHQEAAKFFEEPFPQKVVEDTLQLFKLAQNNPKKTLAEYLRWICAELNNLQLKEAVIKLERLLLVNNRLYDCFSELRCINSIEKCKSTADLKEFLLAIIPDAWEQEPMQYDLPQELTQEAAIQKLKQREKNSLDKAFNKVRKKEIDKFTQQLVAHGTMEVIPEIANLGIQALQECPWEDLMDERIMPGVGFKKMPYERKLGIVSLSASFATKAFSIEEFKEHLRMYFQPLIHGSTLPLPSSQQPEHKLTSCLSAEGNLTKERSVQHPSKLLHSIHIEERSLKALHGVSKFKRQGEQIETPLKTSQQSKFCL